MGYGFEISSYVNIGAAPTVALSFFELFSQFPVTMAAAVSVIYHITPIILQFSKVEVCHNNVECLPRIKSIKQRCHTVSFPSFVAQLISHFCLLFLILQYLQMYFYDFFQNLKFLFKEFNTIQSTLVLLKLESALSLLISNITRKFICYRSTELCLHCTQETLCFQKYYLLHFWD